MKINASVKVLNGLLLANGLLFLLMGCMKLGEDLDQTLLGFGLGLPLAAAYIWRKIRQHRGKSVLIGLGTILLFLGALLFLVMGITSIPDGNDTVRLGFVLGVPLAALYLWRRIRELRELDAQKAAVPAQEINPDRGAEPAPASAKEEVPVTVCPHCGAPSKGEVCSYCGMTK